MICPVCDMGVLEPFTDEKGLRYNICDACGSEIATPHDLRYNKAKFLAKRDKDGNKKW